MPTEYLPDRLEVTAPLRVIASGSPLGESNAGRSFSATDVTEAADHSESESPSTTSAKCLLSVTPQAIRIGPSTPLPPDNGNRGGCIVETGYP